MKRLSAHLAVALVLVIGAFARGVKPHGEVIQITVHSPAVERSRLGDPPDRMVSIYLPPGYESGTRRYPVLYLLHGYSGTDRGWMNPSYVGLPDVMDRLVEDHKIQPMIVVMPNSFNRFGGGFYANSELTGDWEDFIVHELVSYIDGHYRTLATPNTRGIAGHSMGGYGALRLGMRYPDVFTVAYGMSPCCTVWEPSEFRDDVVKAQRATNLQQVVDSGMGVQGALAFAAAFSPDLHNPPFGVDWPFDDRGQPIPDVVVLWRANMLDEISAAYAAGQQRLHAMAFDVGRQDDLLPTERRLDEQMTKLGIAHKYSEYEGTHSDHIRERMQQVVLPFISKALK